MTLVEFLLARIAEDEEVARKAGGEATLPRVPRWIDTGSNREGIRRDDGAPITGHTWPYEAAHIVRWDPARVLAECEAKRRIIERVTTGAMAYYPTFAELSPWTMNTLHILAQPYADHPGWQPEWTLPPVSEGRS